MEKNNYTKDDVMELIKDMSTQIYNKICNETHTHPSQETLKMIGDMDNKFDKLNEKLFGEFGMDKTLVRIEEQTKKTNGRVNKLENWKGYITGGIAVIILFITVFAPIISSQIQDTKNRVASVLLSKQQ